MAEDTITTTDDDFDDDTGKDDLGDAGKRALDAERSARAAAEKAARAAKRELEQLRQSSMSDAEKAISQAKAEARTEAMKEANGRALRAEVRAAASGKLTDPADALLLIPDVDALMDDDGNVDAKALSKAIDDLVKAKPYLAASGASTPAGSADGGARGKAPGPLSMNALIRRGAGLA